MNMKLRTSKRQNGPGAVGILLACLAGYAPNAFSQAASPDIRRDATVLAVEKVMPCVVNIATETIVRVRDPFDEFFRQFWDPYHRRQPPNSQYSLGSGVMIDEEGYLLTNDHVVRRADKIAVKFCAGTNVYEATIVASDPKSDVALLKLKARPGEKFSAIRFAPEDDLLLGETVLSLGNPFGLGGSVSRGILSSKSRLAAKEGEPLVNLRGELIGINVAVLRNYQGEAAEGIGFAIPVRRVLEALSDIFPTEFVKSYWFGARVKVGTTPLVVMSVQPQSPADQAGLKPGDALLEVNGKPPKSFIDFADLLAASPAAKAALTLQRGTARKEVSVRLLPEKAVFNAGMIRDRLGMDLEEVTPELAARYGLRTSEGYIITGVLGDGPAAAAGLERGILVTAMDGKTPPDLAAAAKLIYPKKKGERVLLDIAVRQQVGNYYVLRQGAVELTTR